MNEEWKEMEYVWKQSNPAAPDVDGILEFVTTSAAKFDRNMRWRNLREWIAGALGGGFLLFFLNRFDSPVAFAFALGMLVNVGGVCLLLLLKGRSEGEVDASLSRTEYRRALEEKYARQIRVLRNVKYLFLPPVLLTGGALAWSYAAGSPDASGWYYFVLLCIGSAFAVWLNEGPGVAQIRGEWEQVRRALDDGEIPEEPAS